MRRRGEISPVMWLVLGLIVLLGVLAVVFAKRTQMFGLAELFAGLLG